MATGGLTTEKNIDKIDTVFVEKEQKPGASLKIFSAAVEMEGIAPDLHFAGFPAFPPMDVSDDIARLIREIGKVQGIQKGGIVVAEFERRFFPADLNGITDWVYEEEFAVTNMLSWSPDSECLTFVRFDESEVPEYSMQIYESIRYCHERTRTFARLEKMLESLASLRYRKAAVHNYDERHIGNKQP